MNEFIIEFVKLCSKYPEVISEVSLPSDDNDEICSINIDLENKRLVFNGYVNKN